MKFYKFIFAFFGAILSLNAQVISNENDFSKQLSNLPTIYINDDVNIHFRSPEDIQFLDISNNNLIGDIATNNVGRIKIANDTISWDFHNNKPLGVVTIVGESFMAQYNVMYSTIENRVNTNIEILPMHMSDLDYPKYEMAEGELKRISLDMIKKRTNRHIRKKNHLKMQLFVNQIYTVGEYIFVDVHFKNKTNLRYDIDKIIFSVEDKKIYKSANNQSIYVEPIFQLYDAPYFKKNHRNIFVFKKLTFPNNKVFRIRATENQISGRTIQLDLKYKDLLNADTL